MVHPQPKCPLSPVETDKQLNALKQMFDETYKHTWELEKKLEYSMIDASLGDEDVSIESIWELTKKDLEAIKNSLSFIKDSLATLEHDTAERAQIPTTQSQLINLIPSLESKIDQLFEQISNQVNSVRYLTPCIDTCTQQDESIQPSMALHNSWLSPSNATTPSMDESLTKDCISELDKSDSMAMVPEEQSKLNPHSEDASATSCAQAEETYVTADFQAIQEKIDLVITLLPQIPSPLEALIVSPDSKIIVIGDVHGGFKELIATLNRINHDEECFSEESPFCLKDDFYLVFTGDIADWGFQGLETWDSILTLKIMNPEHVYITRGNHEHVSMSQSFGLFGRENSSNSGDIDKIFPKEQAEQLKQKFSSLFEHLPLALFIGKINPVTTKIHFGMFCHGGIDRRSMPTVRQLLRLSVAHTNQNCQIEFKTTDEFIGFNWTDFYAKTDLCQESPRGPGVKICNSIVVKKYLQAISKDNFQVDFIARGHQHEPGGICKLNEPGQKLDWIPLEDQRTYPVEQGSVFTFLCLPPIFEEFNIRETGCGIFSTDSQGTWNLKAYITPYSEHDQYL